MSEKKDKWSLMIYPSIAREMERIISEQFRGNKGLTTSAACLMFAMMHPDRRQEFVDALILAEGRGYDGSMFEAASEIINPAAAPTATSATEQHARAIEDAILGSGSTAPKPPPRGGPPAGRSASSPEVPKEKGAHHQTRKD